MVNIPLSITIFLSVFLLHHIGFGWNISCLISSGIGWYFWDKFLNNWKTWALNKGVSKERLYKLGKYGLINFYKHKIFD